MKVFLTVALLYSLAVVKADLCPQAFSDNLAVCNNLMDPTSCANNNACEWCHNPLTLEVPYSIIIVELTAGCYEGCKPKVTQDCEIELGGAKLQVIEVCPDKSPVNCCPVTYDELSSCYSAGQNGCASVSNVNCKWCGATFQCIPTLPQDCVLGIVLGGQNEIPIPSGTCPQIGDMLESAPDHDWVPVDGAPATTTAVSGTDPMSSTAMSSSTDAASSSSTGASSPNPGNVGGNAGGNAGGNVGGDVGGNAGGNVGGDVGGNVGGDVGGNAGGAGPAASSSSTGASQSVLPVVLCSTYTCTAGTLKPDADNIPGSNEARCCDANVDCAGTWSACTGACEKGSARTFTTTAGQSGAGAVCPVAVDCQPGSGSACLGLKVSSATRAMRGAVTILVGVSFAVILA